MRKQIKIFKSASKVYFTASLFFPPKMRSDVTTLYAWFRVADDFVDAAEQDASGLDEFFHRTKLSIKGSFSGEPVIDEYAQLFNDKNFEMVWVDAFAKAMKQDLTKNHYATLAQTLDYMHGSAEVVGLMMNRVMGIDKSADNGAMLMGRSMQYINMIRDVGQDIEEYGRVYLPKSVFSRFGLNELSKQEAIKKPAKFSKFLLHELDRYDEWCDSAENQLKKIPKMPRVAVKTASDMYRWTAQQIRKDPMVVFEKQVRPSNTKVFMHGVKVLGSTISGKSDKK